MSLSISSTVNITVSAAANINSSINGTSNKLVEIQNNKSNTKNRLNELNSEIDKILFDIDKNKENMNNLSNKIKNNQIKLKSINSKYSTTQKLYYKRIHDIYTSGYDQLGYFLVILNSKNMADFISRSDTIYRIIKNDRSILLKISHSKTEISNQKKVLLSENNKLVKLKKINEITLSSLNNDIKKENSILEKINKNESDIVSKSLKSKVSVSKQSTLSRGSKFSITKSKYIIATAYCDDGITAMGLPTLRNPNGYSTIAVDPRVIPLGSKVYVENYGYALAVDTGGLIKGDKIDLFMSSKKDANNWGIRKVKLYILN